MSKANYKLICGDSIEVMRTLKPESIDFIFADPPYKLSNDGFTVKSGRAVSVNKGDWDKSSGFEADLEFHEEWIRACKNLLTSNGSIMISGTYHSIYKCGFLLQKLGFRIINDIAWFKPNGAPALAGRNFTASHETVIWASKSENSKHTFNYKLSKNWESDSDSIKRPDKQMRSVWMIPSTPKREKGFGPHPTQKPLELLNRAILLCTNPNDLVLDPFCGSGTTGVAAITHHRRFIGIDLDSKYIALSKARIEGTLATTSKPSSKRSK